MLLGFYDDCMHSSFLHYISKVVRLLSRVLCFMFIQKCRVKFSQSDVEFRLIKKKGTSLMLEVHYQGYPLEGEDNH